MTRAAVPHPSTQKRRQPARTPRLHVVTGKGGVGKSAFAAALCVRLARTGHRVLALELGEPAGLAHLFGVRPEVHGEPMALTDRLSLAYVDGAEALSEYLQRHLPFPGLMAAMFSHPLYRAFVSAGPGVRELMSIGKVRDELLGLSTGMPAWDALVVDAGASGRALQWLGMPAATVHTFARGLARREASRVVRTLADPNITAVHVVALPELMPLEEAAEVIERLRALSLPVGALVINRCRPPAPAGADGAVARLLQAQDPAATQMGALAGRALGWLDVQERGIASLRARVGVEPLRLPHLLVPALDRPALERLADVLPIEMWMGPFEGARP